ncbi:MAG: hypothetical protein P4M11_11645 [Candidatus Pacebacteria bacterium]|nr:hypothetical protein [Candidatus Paceibacterota bacterium]
MKVSKYSTELKDILLLIAQRLAAYIAIGNKLKRHSRHTKLFKEKQHVDRVFRLRTYGGFAQSLPEGFVYQPYRLNVHTPTVNDICEFLNYIFSSVQLPFECAVICLIYVERLVVIAAGSYLRNRTTVWHCVHTHGRRRCTCPACWRRSSGKMSASGTLTLSTT